MPYTRRCLILGESLEGLHGTAVICGSRFCKAAYDRMKRAAKKSKKPRYCEFCGTSITLLRTDATKCGSRECLNAYFRKWFKEDRRKKREERNKR